MTNPSHRTGVVLSGGGARGAYEVGVLQGIVEALASAATEAPFSVFTGTSVGALNATWLAAHADRPDMAVDGLAAQWRELRIDTHLRLRPLWQLFGKGTWSLLDVRALADLMTGSVPWDRLHHNVAAGHVHALAVAALEVATGRTVVFAELDDDTPFLPTRSANRVGERTRIGPEHVLGSTALPFLFPSREVGCRWFADGGLRFNTPISPALRLGADKLVIVSLLHDGFSSATGAPACGPDQRYPSPAFLAGKTLNALLLDPIVHDLQMLDRFNRVWATLERVLPPEALAEAHRVIAEERGLAYRQVQTLVFRPSEDIGVIAARWLSKLRSRRPVTFLLTRAMRAGVASESDLASFLLFDHGFADALIALGLADARARADEIRAFFSGPSAR